MTVHFNLSFALKLAAIIIISSIVGASFGIVGFGSGIAGTIPFALVGGVVGYLFLKNRQLKNAFGKTLPLLGVVTILSGCMNMPTPTAQITGAHASGLKYESYSCTSLASELNSLARRENQLVRAQEQRIKTSQMQAFWWGFGQGDGLEASELANVRGEHEAIRTALESKACDPALMPVVAPPPAPVTPEPTARSRNWSRSSAGEN